LEEKRSSQSVPSTTTNPASGSPSIGSLLTKADWKCHAFGEIEFSKNDHNIIMAHFGKVPPDDSAHFSLGTRSAIPVLCVLKDGVLDGTEAFAVVRIDGKFSAVSETGHVVADLNAMNISPATVSRVREVFTERAISVEHDIDKGMYEGIVVIFPA
jgi:hypothetical protein